jgi:hypothetical protein
VTTKTELQTVLENDHLCKNAENLLPKITGKTILKNKFNHIALAIVLR